MNNTITTIDNYIAGFPEKTQAVLTKMRAIIKKVVPEAEEKISYGIPTFFLNGNLVHFGGFKNHIGFYPTPSGIEEFKKDLAAYKGAKGSIQFPLDKPLPAELIKRMVKFRVQKNTEKAGVKKNVKPVPVKAAPKKATDEIQVNDWVNKQPPAVKTDINAIRKIIKAASGKLLERIKWNAPSFYYKEDIVTFGPYKTHKLLLVFHHPFVVTIKSPLLEGDYKDRRLVHFKNKEDVKKNKKELSNIIQQIVTAIDKKSTE
jgi:uncharacterized protein YdhG (YjbR/CyaY superfamily)